MKKTYWQICLDLWDEKEWITNLDYQDKTKGSPKFTSRISDMRKRGIDIADIWRDNKEEGRHKAYKLNTPKEDVKRIMSRKRGKVA